MKESALYSKIVKDLQTRYPNCKIIKIHGDEFMEIGLPDLIGCLPPQGRTIVIETKVKYNKPTPIQLYRLEEYRKAGAISFWCNSFDDYLSKLKEFNL